MVMRMGNVILVSLINFLLSFALESSLIFIPLMAAQMGASDFQVGLVGAVYGGAYLISSLYCGRQSDRWGRMAFIRLGLLLSSAAFAVQLFAYNLYFLMLARAAVGLSMGISTAVLIAYAYELKADMGRYSSYGSLGWIAGSLIAVWVTDFKSLFIVSMIACVVAYLVSQRLPGQTAERYTPKGRAVPSLRKVIGRGCRVYLAVFLRHLGAAAVWIILPLYFTSRGLDRSWIAWLWSINFAVQAFVMRYLERFNPNKVFAFGQVLSIFVFILYVFCEGPWLLMGVQALLGVAWACLYVGGLLLVLRGGEERGTASGIFQSTLNLCAALGPFIGGVIAQHWDYQGVMIFAAVLGVAGLAVAVPQTGGALSAGNPRN